MAAPAIKLPDAILTLRDEHRYMKLLLDTLEEHVTAANLANAQNYFLIQDIVRYMHEYPDTVHHPTEDLMFDKLVRRNPASEPDVARLRREHDWLTDNTASILHLLDRAAETPSVDAAEAVRKGAAEYIQRLRQHIQFEEDSLFPTAIRSLGSQDWHDIELRLASSQDPLFGSAVGRDYRVLYEFFADRASRLSQQVTRFGFLQLDNMILSADAIETGITEFVALVEEHADTLIREFRAASSGPEGDRSLLGTLSVKAACLGTAGRSMIDIGIRGTAICCRSLGKATALFFKGDT